MTRYVAILAMMLALAGGCARTPDNPPSSADWIGPPTDADGRPILPPSYLAPHIQGCQP